MPRASNCLNVYTCKGFEFFFPRVFLAAGRFSGAELFFWAASRQRLFLYWPVSTGKSKSRPSSTGLRGDWSAQLGWCRIKELAEGWEISIKALVGGQEAAPWVRRAGQRDTTADAVAARSDGGLDLALAWASMRIKLDTSLLHLPPTSMPRTTKRHRRGRSFPCSCVHPAMRLWHGFLPVTLAHLTW